MPLIETRGGGSAQGFGSFARSVPSTYIEDVFSTYLYTGNGSTQTITNGVDLSGKGGLVWVKARTAASSPDHTLFDTARSAGFGLASNNAAGQSSYTQSFFSTGFSVGDNITNQNFQSYTSWTFRKCPKFFDVVTYTGASPSSVTVNHNLGSVPGCIIIKCTNDVASWAVYHRSTGLGQILYLNGTQAASSDTTFITAVNATSFTVGDNAFTNNSPTKTYVAYLFAHNAGGFGLSGNDSVISCGSYTGNGNGTQGPVVNLGWEPQWLIVRNSSIAEDWFMVDNMRGMTANGMGGYVKANTSGNEGSVATSYWAITSTGFQVLNTTNSAANTNGNNYIYIAIRRGPMRTPTTGTSVYTAVSGTGGSSTTPCFVTNWPVDFAMVKNRAANAYWADASRLQGEVYLQSSSTAAETASSNFAWDYSTGWSEDPTNSTNFFSWNFRRAPGFFDVVCYTGTGGTTNNINHNLNAVPELVITKRRSGSAEDWAVTVQKGSVTSWHQFLSISTSSGSTVGNYSSYVTTSTFDTTAFSYNTISATYVAYLFASVPGVSKVGSYTGNGNDGRIIDCGFTSGARFVMIKRTDAPGDWFVWDASRGIVAGNDPWLSLNTTATEDGTADAIDPHASGFIVNTNININVNGSTYIYLAIGGGMIGVNGEVTYSTPGTYTWTAPANVTSVSVVCVGAGGGPTYDVNGNAGGGGGALAYANNISVIPGFSYTVVVGAGGSYSVAGGASSFNGTSVRAGGGGSGSVSGGAGGTVLNGTGGAGGVGGAGGAGNNGGGGGAGGYSGTGGAGSAGTTSASGNAGSNGSGGGGGGGTGGNSASSSAGAGGGVGLFGQGANGQGGSVNYPNGILTHATGGSSGGNATASAAGTPGGGASADAPTGASGAVRIMWGDGRSFPNAAGSV